MEFVGLIMVLFLLLMIGVVAYLRVTARGKGPGKAACGSCDIAASSEQISASLIVEEPILTPEQEKMRDTEERRKGIQDRLVNLFASVDYDVDTEPYDALGRTLSTKHANAIVAVLMTICAVYESVHLGALSLEGVGIDKKELMEEEVGALLYLGCRTQVNEYLYGQLIARGVPRDLSDEAFDVYEENSTPTVTELDNPEAYYNV